MRRMRFREVGIHRIHMQINCLQVHELFPWTVTSLTNHPGKFLTLKFWDTTVNTQTLKWVTIWSNYGNKKLLQRNCLWRADFWNKTLPVQHFSGALLIDLEWAELTFYINSVSIALPVISHFFFIQIQNLDFGWQIAPLPLSVQILMTIVSGFWSGIWPGPGCSTHYELRVSGIDPKMGTWFVG